VDKVFVEQHVSDPKIKAFIPMYRPLELIRCKKCGKNHRQPKRINKNCEIIGKGLIKCFNL